MRWIVAALVALTVTACSDPAGETCEEPQTVQVPENPGNLDTVDSQCLWVVWCLQGDECEDEECARDCAGDVFGDPECGCCGDECTATCDAIVDAALALHTGCPPGSDPDECAALDAACRELSFEDRQRVD